jgi:sugar O-acyltransferase (sialic acid O-acetyltransferase NeuD family)
MSKSGLILVGAGGHARACIDVIEQEAKYTISGLIGLPEERSTTLLGYLIRGMDSDLVTLREKFSHALIAVGQIQTASHRKRMYEQLLALEFTLPTIIAPTAHVSRHALIGAGTIVMHGAIVNAGARVGKNCIVNSKALIEHDAIIEDHCHISTGAILNGGVQIGAGSFVGSGSLIKEGIEIGQDCVIGMGLTIRHKLLDCVHMTHNRQI